MRVVQQLQISLGLLFLLLLAGMAGYRFIEGMGWFDALYMTVITLSTVGYGEVKPLSTGGKVFTVIIILMGVGIAAWVLRNVVEIIVGEEVRHLWGRWKMERKVNRLEGHYIICGYGRMGRQVAREFARRGVPFVVVDSDPKVVEELREEGLPCVEGDATRDEVLESAGVRRAKGLVAVADTDADNVFIILTAKSLNPDLFVVARSETEEGEDKLRKAGADRVIAPYAIGGRRIAVAALRPAVCEFLDVVMHREEVAWEMEEFVVGRDSELEGRSLREADVRGRTGAIVLAIKSPSGELFTNPSPDRVLRAGDVLIALGTPDQLERLGEMVD